MFCALLSPLIYAFQDSERTEWVTSECYSRFSLQWSSRTTHTRDVAFSVKNGKEGLPLDQNPRRAVISVTNASDKRKLRERNRGENKRKYG